MEETHIMNRNYKIGLYEKAMPDSLSWKEKLLAAKSAGIKKVLVPQENKPDVEELEEEITEGVEIVFVTKVQQVLKESLVER